MFRAPLEERLPLIEQGSIPGTVAAGLYVLFGAFCGAAAGILRTTRAHVEQVVRGSYDMIAPLVESFLPVGSVSEGAQMAARTLRLDALAPGRGLLGVFVRRRIRAVLRNDAAVSALAAVARGDRTGPASDVVRDHFVSLAVADTFARLRLLEAVTCIVAALVWILPALVARFL